MILSIVVPVYNVEDFLERCISSFYEQNLKETEFEVIIVNDGSSDRSFEIAKSLSLRFKNIKLFSQNNGGLSSARNTGIRHSSGEYIMFVDSDDWIAPNTLGVINRKLQTEKPDVLCICAADYKDGNIIRRFSFHNQTCMSGPKAMKLGLKPCAPFSIVRREFLTANDLHFFEGIIHEDTEFTPRVHYLAQKVSFLDEIVYIVYYNSNSLTKKSLYSPKRFRDLITVVCPHLDDFSHRYVTSDTKVVFHNLISLYYNNALACVYDASVDETKEFNSILLENKNLIKHLISSSVLKYKVEGLLFLFTKPYFLQVYRLVQKINNNGRLRLGIKI